jgi:hypothetical protein
VELRATRIVGCWLISTEWGKRLRDGGEACWEGLFRGWRGCDVAILLYVTDSYGWFLAYERKAASQLPNPGNLQQTKTAGFPDEVLLSTILDGGRRAGWRRFSWSCFDPLQACVLPIIHTDRQPRTTASTHLTAPAVRGLTGQSKTLAAGKISQRESGRMDGRRTFGNRGIAGLRV